MANDVDSVALSDLLTTTYDECFAEAKAAIALEEQGAIDAADKRWRAALGRARYFNSLLPRGHTFSRENDLGGAAAGLRDLELTAQEHVDLHEGLRLSIQSLKLGESRGVANKNDDDDGGDDDNDDDHLAYGDVGEQYSPSIRPPLPPRVSSSHPSPQYERRDDRSESPGTHKLRKTLRTSKPGFRPRDSRNATPGADMAAAAAWIAKDSRGLLERAPSSETSKRTPTATSRSHTQISSGATEPEQVSLRFDRHTRRLVPRENAKPAERPHSPLSTESAAAAMKKAATGARNTAASSSRDVGAHAIYMARRSADVAGAPRARQSSEMARPSLSSTARGSGVGRTSGSSRHERRLNEEPITVNSNGTKSTSKEDLRTPAPPEAEGDESATPDDPAAMGWDTKRDWVLRNLPPGVEKATATQILDEVDPDKDVVRWGDIAGLDEAKNALKEAVVYPFLRPDLFRGLREPPRGILLFGPPGTGKTMLARAVATESESTYIAVTASTLNSKYLGESEKHVRALFAVARSLAPSIIFVDEVDAVLSRRSSSGEHEASRRLKTEFLIQWSSLEKTAGAGKQLNGAGDNRVLVLAATNRPWDLDDAATRRFARRQYIPLPEAETRRVQFRTMLEGAGLKHCLTEADVEELVRLTEGYSGSDITHLARQASYGPLRSHGEAVLRMNSEDIRPIDMSDFMACLRTVRPSVDKNSLKQFEDWAGQFGERIG